MLDTFSRVVFLCCNIRPLHVLDPHCKPIETHQRVGVPLVPGSTPEAVERVSHGEVSLLGETLEDMSLSSTSSLERHNDTSQEYMDDFDNLGMNEQHSLNNRHGFQGTGK